MKEEVFCKVSGRWDALGHLDATCWYCGCNSFCCEKLERKQLQSVLSIFVCERIDFSVLGSSALCCIYWSILWMKVTTTLHWSSYILKIFFKVSGTVCRLHITSSSTTDCPPIPSILQYSWKHEINLKPLFQFYMRTGFESISLKRYICWKARFGYAGGCFPLFNGTSIFV